MSAELLKALGVAILCIAASTILKKLGSPFAVALVAACILSIVMIIMPKMKEVIDVASEIGSGSSVSAYFPVILKICAVAFIGEIASDIASSSGEANLSKAISFAGRCEIVFLSLPLIKELVNGAESIAGA
ncbi:MAG: hypothetical protein IJS45_01605 [Clostridia bacterium]|nr:hypothetical protein [Clostridia bacterium]